MDPTPFVSSFINLRNELAVAWLSRCLGADEACLCMTIALIRIGAVMHSLYECQSSPDTGIRTIIKPGTARASIK